MVQNPVTRWNDSHDKMDFSFKSEGMDIRGNVQLKEGKVIVEGRLPLLARIFTGKIESAIKAKLEEIL